MTNEGLSEDQFIKVRNIFGLPGGDTMLISKKPNKDTGAYTIIDGAGGLLEVADDSGALATMLENVGTRRDSLLKDGGSTSGGDLDSATQDANIAAEQANASGGGDTAISAPMTNIGGTTSSVSTTNITSTEADNSLKTRQRKYSW